MSQHAAAIYYTRPAFVSTHAKPPMSEFYFIIKFIIHHLEIYQADGTFESLIGELKYLSQKLNLLISNFRYLL